MELKTKYQYTYFIYPYVIKENKFTKYLLKLLKDKNCELKMFKKENDLSLYSYFSHRARNYMFNSFNYSKTRLARLNDLPLETKAAILAQNPCTIFEYNIKKDFNTIIGKYLFIIGKVLAIDNDGLIELIDIKKIEGYLFEFKNIDLCNNKRIGGK